MGSSRSKVSRFDLLNAAVAALRDGVGPLYNLYLVNNLGFGAKQIGLVLGAGSAATLISQVPLGYLFDHLRPKRLLIAAAGLGMLVGALVMRATDQPSFQTTLLVQLLFGVSTSILTLGIPALTVAVTEDEQLGDRMARNEVFAKAGNLAALAIAGALSQFFALKIIFSVWALLALPVVVLGLTMKSKRKVMRRTRWSKTAVTSSGSFLWFVAAVFLLYLANTGALVIFEQVFAPAHANGGAGWIAGVSALAQGAVTLTIMGLARVKSSRNLVLMLAATFGIIIVRLTVLAAGGTVGNLVTGQILDGVVGGALFSIPIRLLAEQHRGEFNVLSGVLGSVGALGALASVFATGWLIGHFGHAGSLFTYVVPAGFGVLVVMISRRQLAGREHGVKPR